MTQNNSNDIIKCETCGYEFLILNHDRCPKCGGILRRVEKDPFIENARMNDSLLTEREYSHKRKIVHYFVDVVIIILSLVSIGFCSFINPILGIIVGILVFIVTYCLGKKYAEQWIIEKIIVRDHYH